MNRRHNDYSVDLSIAIIGFLSLLMVTGCSSRSGDMFGSAASGGATNLSSSYSPGATTGVSQTEEAERLLSMKINTPVFCQYPPYNYDSSLPSCLYVPPGTCPQSQVPDGNGNCVDYVCDSVTVLNVPTDGSTLHIPDRSPSTHGVCYAIHLINGISEGPSYLTTTHDSTVVSRNHDLNSGDPTNHWNPYLMGSAYMQFEMANQHQVDLTGAPDASTPVLVDNFIIVGIAPVLATTQIQPMYYGAFGTSDSTTTFAGGTGNILLATVPLQLTSFASGGTASVGPLNVSNEVATGIAYNLDLRAEDCGGARNLSDIYIQFR
jgi:hypothetical protein